MDKNEYIALAPIFRKVAASEVARFFAEENDREDVVQDVMLRMWEQHATLDADTKRLKGYAVTLARNRSLDILKSRRRHPLLRLLHHDDKSDDETFTFAEKATEQTPQSRLEDKEAVEIYRKAFMQLPPAWQKILLMRNDHNLTFAEIAQVLGTTESSVRGTLSKARTRLLTLIKQRMT